MSPAVARGALAAVVVATGAAVWVSRGSSTEDIVEPRRIVSATELPVEASSAPAVEAAGWINTDPLSSADLDGKVVLYDFWTFGCINCRHTIPYVKSAPESRRSSRLALAHHCSGRTPSVSALRSSPLRLPWSLGRRDSCGCAGCPLGSNRPPDLCSSCWASCS